MAKWGLRKKSLMALLLACLVALAPAALIGWQLLDGVRDHFGRAFADNFTQLNRQRILAPVSRELALSLRLADSEVTRAGCAMSPIRPRASCSSAKLTATAAICWAGPTSSPAPPPATITSTTTSPCPRRRATR